MADLTDNLSMSVLDDMNPHGTLVTGINTVGEAAYRRLATAPGHLYYNEEYGGGISVLVGNNYSDIQIKQMVSQELLEDERIESVSTSITRTVNDDGSDDVQIDCTIESPEGDFTLSVLATPALVKLISLEPAVK